MTIDLPDWNLEILITKKFLLKMLFLPDELIDESCAGTLGIFILFTQY